MHCWAKAVILLAVVMVTAGCTTSSSHRGVVEFGRMSVATAVNDLPRPVEAPVVRYPEVLLAQSVEGTAELSFVVGVDGIPREIKVVNASDPAFGEAAAAALQVLRYVPAELGGKRVPCRVEQTFFFRID
jgi:TonB family protein